MAVSDDTSNETKTTKDNLNIEKPSFVMADGTKLKDEDNLESVPLIGNDNLKEENLRLKAHIEHLQSVVDIYYNRIQELFSIIENNAMDDIAEMRAKRIELERFKAREL